MTRCLGLRARLFRRPNGLRRGQCGGRVDERLRGYHHKRIVI